MATPNYEGLLDKFVTALRNHPNDLEYALDHVISRKPLVTYEQRLSYKKDDRFVARVISFVSDYFKITEQELIEGATEVGSWALSFSVYYIKSIKNNFSYPRLAVLFGRKSHSMMHIRVMRIRQLDSNNKIDAIELEKIKKLTELLNKHFNGRKQQQHGTGKKAISREKQTGKRRK